MINVPEAYTDAVRSLGAKLDGERPKADLDALVFHIMEACRRAERYLTRKVDNNRTLRQADRDAAKSLQDQQRAIRELRSFARRHPRQSGFALALANFRGGTRNKGPMTDLFIEFLDDYEKGLAQTTKRAGPWTHRFFAANLVFAQPIDGRKRHPSVGVGLLFHLVLLLRNYTAGERLFALYRTGETMPDRGKPHYDLAAEFARVATGEDLRSPEHALRKLINENPGIGLSSWPQG
jgi:hypothetical protein